jgi:ADP-heptose:LPS heptosyltransferase
MSRIFVDLSVENGGLGDMITLIPTIRLLKKNNPDKELIVVTWFQNIDILAYCDYVDYIVPIDIMNEDWKVSVNFNQEDKVFSLIHSFLEQHKDHIVKSPISEIAKMSPEGANLEFELSVRDFDLPVIEEHKKKLLDLAKGKKIVGLGAAITMYSRMYPQKHWQELTNILRANNYFVVTLGHASDMNLDVDFDARGLYPIRHIPKILDVFDSVFVVNSGMMHLAGVNQDVHLVILSVGQFPAELVVPFRHGKLSHNSTIIRHTCPIVNKCFKDHITEVGINEQCNDFINRWQQESRRDFPVEEGRLPIKFICWKYCNKKTNKFSCSDMSPALVYEAFEKRKDIVITTSDCGFPPFHGEIESAVKDYQTWKDIILLSSGDPRVYVNILDSDDNLFEKMKAVKTLFPKYNLVVIGRKKHVALLKECEYVYYVLPIELLSRTIKFGKQDIMLKL